MSVTTIPLLESLQGDWINLQIELAGHETLQLGDVYPFISVTDLKRLIWIQQEGNPRWAPERVFLGVRSAAGIRPIEFHWPSTVTTGGVDLPDPVVSRAPNPAIVDESGNRKPIGPTMIGSLILETALSPELIATGSLPIVTAISLADLIPPAPEDLTSALYGGFYQLYFPWLTAPSQVLDAMKPTVALGEAYAASIAYTVDRMKRIRVVERALAKKAGGTSVIMNAMTRLRWTLPPPARKPESLERTFYGLQATATIPFLRYFAVGRSPLLKLALKPDGLPFLEDDKVFAQYLNQPAPTDNVVLAKIPITSAYVEKGAAFTLFMFEDGACDISIEVPQRGATYVAAVATDAQRVLGSVIASLGFGPDVTPILRDLHATYKWTHPDPRRATPLSTGKLEQRVAALTPFLEPVPSLPDDKALAVFQWRAVSNYESETAQFAYITQMILRGSHPGEEGLVKYAAEVAEKFGITSAAASAILERWAERRAEAVAPAVGPGAGSSAVPKHSTGASVAILGAHPAYTMEIQGVDTMEELQRLVSVVGVLLGASSSDISIAPPAPLEQAAAAAVAIADATVVDAAGEEDIELGEMDPAMAALMADLGFGGGEEPGEVSDEEPGEVIGLVIEELPITLDLPAAPAPNLEAAMAAVEEECRGTPWAPGEAPLKVSSDYYMAKLRKEDKVLFAYPADPTKRAKSYSKSCQRRDDRQPNIMTLAEYARVKRCYEDRVRFVDLPPRKASDLPQDPTWTPKKRLPDDYFFTDHTPGPTFGLPLWSVYGYENKTRPGEYLYVICAELWCDRDNLPLIRSEYEGTQGRGFTKPPMTCPFCAGRPIASMAAPVSGESVIVRAPKASTGKLHRYIGTITRNKHPAGYLLPCCDTTPRLLEKYMKAAFSGQLVLGRDLVVEDGDEEEGEEAVPPPELELEAPVGEEGSIDYRQRLGSMHTQYILGNDKALEAGKIGLLPPLLDAFFGQSGPKSLESRGIRPTFVEGANLFVRIGVDTRTRATGLNLFAGLAPFLGFESAEQCQRHILTRRMVRAFESANYGTLVQEFAAKATVTEEDLTNSLPEFAGEFGYKLDGNRPHVVRLYRAWSAFLSAMADNKTPKRLRHIEHLLAQPGTITNRGLLLVTLEQKGDKIIVVCPSFGIPMASVFGDVPIAFMWHDKRDESWEPIVLYNGTKDAVRFFGERTSELEMIPAHLRSSLQQWLRDWRSSSLGCGRPTPPPHVWTPDRNTADLPRLTQLRGNLKGEDVSPVALVRDRSNRLAGILLRTQIDGNQFFVPCLDDGSLAEPLPRVFEAESIPPAPLDAYLKFYATLAATYPGLAPTKLLARMEESTQIVGFMTAVGTMVPTAAAPLGQSELPVQQVDAFPWERDAIILRSPDSIGLPGAVLEEATASVEDQLAEAYQYLRLSLSHWLIRDARGPAMRNALAGLLNSNLPLYEKRKRMDITLEPLIREWISVDVTQERKALSLLRQDCLSLEGEACSGADGCRWVSDSGAGVATAGSRCLIHAPTREAGTDPVRIFTARLSDELLRYASARRDVLNNTVAAIRTPSGAVRVGDELFMATKPKEPTRAIMERLGFTGQMAISFPEEMLRFEGAEEEVVAVERDGERTEVLPASWIEKGLQIPTPPIDIEDANRLAFAEGTGRPIEKWEEFIKSRRQKLGVEGDSSRPFQWSQQDFYVIASLTLSNILFVHQEASGAIKIDRWIQPPAMGGAGARLEQQIYMIFWGPRELLISRGKVYRFLTKDLPSDLLTALDGASPVPENEAKGYSDQALAAEPEPEPEPKPVVASAAETVVAPIVAGVVDTIAAASDAVAVAAKELIALPV